MSIFSPFGKSAENVLLLGKASLAAFNGDPVPQGWDVLTPQSLGLETKFSSGNYFVNESAAAIVLRQGNSWIVSFRGTDDAGDAADFPSLLSGNYIAKFDPLLSAIASVAPPESTFSFTGASLGGGATNQMASIAASAYGGRFASSDFVAFASPNISNASNILNFGFDNDPIFRLIEDYRDNPSSLDNLTVANQAFMQGNFDGLRPYDETVHDNTFIAFDTFSRLTQSRFQDLIQPDSIIIIDDFEGAVQDINPTRVDSGAFYLGEARNDWITGRGGNDFIEGFGGDDTLSGGRGDDWIDGGTGNDIAIFLGFYSEFSITYKSDGTVVVEGPDGADTLIDVEVLRFNDLDLSTVEPSRDPIDWTGDLSSIKVSASTYQFFTGSVPTSEGFEFLISSNANANDLNDPYYAPFNQENRFINFASNLGTEGDGRATYDAAYDTLSFDAAVRQAYDAIVGNQNAADLDAALNFFYSAETYYEALAIERGVARSGVSLEDATKIVMIGSLLHEATKGGTGIYGEAVEMLTADIMDDGQTNSFGMDLFA